MLGLNHVSKKALLEVNIKGADCRPQNVMCSLFVLNEVVIHIVIITLVNFVTIDYFERLPSHLLHTINCDIF